jgi:prepilin-type processing-associated H-X9-DG protein
MQYWDEKGNYQHLAGSYTFNGYCLRRHPSGNDSNLVNSQAGSADRLWDNGLRNTATIPVICDGNWPSAWPKEADALPTSGPNNTYPIYDPATTAGSPPTTNLNPNWRRIVVARHGFAINVGFLDGHATTTQLPDLWLLNWHAVWDVKQIPGGYPAGLNTIRALLKRSYRG